MHDYEPWQAWEGKTPGEMDRWIKELGQEDKGYEAPEKQYFVAAWENMRLVPWIAFYGTWDFTRATGEKAWLGQFDQGFEIDRESGAAYKRGSGEGYRLQSIHVLYENKVEKYTYPENDGPHLVLVPEGRVHYLMDDTAYNSMMVQLLIAKPDDPRLTEHFKLVYNGFPAVRVYEVK
jgi:dolichyl-diphosphooligosaccharide--protein glycosyltransferase